jgi:protein-L-isoaspartate(D-aspartate) O-methyltransferase
MRSLNGLLERLDQPDMPRARAALRRQLEYSGAPVRIVEAIASVPRHAFVPAGLGRTAYVAGGNWLPSGAVLPGPAVAARILSALDPQPNERVLESGTGCGYLTVLLSQLAREVVTIDTSDRTDGVIETADLDNIKRASIGGAIDGVFDAVLVGVPHVTFSPMLLAGAPRGVVVVGPPLGPHRLLLARVSGRDAAPELFDLGPVLLPSTTLAYGSPIPTPHDGTMPPMEGS